MKPGVARLPVNQINQLAPPNARRREYAGVDQQSLSYDQHSKVEQAFPFDPRSCLDCGNIAHPTRRKAVVGRMRSITKGI